jgi:putative Mg2+ transporter-C (MgtC) family protein
MLSFQEMLLRVGLATALAAVIGYERDVRGRPAGLRTHTLVGLSSALFMVVSTYFAFSQSYTPGGIVEVDASRIAASVVSGVGFLAGGAILRTGVTVQGLTTAAGLWLVAAIGLAVGGGMYSLGLVGTVIGVLALTALRRFEDRGERFTARKVELTLGKAASARPLLDAFAALKCKITRTEYEGEIDQETLTLTLDVRMPLTVTDDAVIALLAKHDVHRFHLEPLS